MTLKKPLIKYSKRKTVAISVDNTGQVIVRAPKNACINDLDSYLLKHSDWIIKRQKKVLENQAKLYSLDYNPEEINTYKQEARKGFEKTASEYAKKLKLPYKKLRLSGASKRWGSCSSKGNINLNWKLYFTSKEIQEYVIVHELMHLRHMNHSKRFWKAVAEVIPDYKKRIKELKQQEYLLLLSN